MRKRSFWFVLLLVSGLMLACSNGLYGYYVHGYQKTNNLFTGDSYVFVAGDGKGHYLEYPLTNIDIKSFKILGEDTYAKDNFHVYYAGRILDGADSASFSVLGGGHAKDHARVYFEGAVIPGAEPQSFASLDGYWGKDSHAAYYRLQPMKVCDPGTFVFLSGSAWQRDSQCVYSSGKKLPDADPASFAVLNLDFGRDKNHVYYGDKIIQGADPVTFRVKGTSAYSPDSTMGQDKNGCYFEDEPRTCN